MKTLHFKPKVHQILEDFVEELSPESRPTLSFETPTKDPKKQLNKTKLLELFGIEV